MINFAEAFALPIGTRVRVSDGLPPPGGEGLARNIWRSHNHTGNIVEKTGGQWRTIKVEEDEDDGVQVAFTITEQSGDKFEVL